MTKSTDTPQSQDVSLSNQNAEGEDSASQTAAIDASLDSNKGETPQPSSTEAVHPKQAEKTAAAKKKPTPPPKPRRPQSVLFLSCESDICPSDQEERKNAHAASSRSAQRITRDPIDKLPLLSCKEFGDDLLKFFVNKKEKTVEETAFSDARLLLFPLRTMRGIFTWVTSVRQLQRFDAALRDTTCAPRWPLVGLSETEVLSGPNNACVVKEHLAIEEYNFPVRVETRVQGISRWLAANALPQGPAQQWWRAKVARDLILVPEEVFLQLVEQNLSRSAMVDPTVLEEVLPKETVLYAPLGPSLAEAQLELPLRVIGKHTESGNGICRLHVVQRANNKAKRKKKRKPSTPQKHTANTATLENSETVASDKKDVQNSNN